MADINILGVGSNSNIEAQVDPTFQSLRANLKPLEYSASGLVGGHYFATAYFTSTAAALTALSPIFSVRWADSRMLYVLKRITIVAGLSTAFTNAQICDYDVIRCHSFSASDSGGTGIILDTFSQKARTATMSASLLSNSGDLRISSGGPLTAGTRTLDTQPFGYAIPLVQSAAAANATGVQVGNMISLYELRDFGVHPLIFATNEGFIIRAVTAHGAAGVVKHGIALEWAEVPSY